MDFGKLNSWLQVSANIGIVLGLLLVGVQLKQNSDLARVQMLNEESDWRARVESEVPFYLSDPYSRAWWANYGGDPSPSVPEELRLAIEAVIADDQRSVTDYILAPQRNMKPFTPPE